MENSLQSVLNLHRINIMNNWIGKVAVVTGASAGIGAAVTKALASKGMIVVGLARRAEKVEEISKETEGKIFPFTCDVSDLCSVKKSFKWIEEKFGAISVLINNAGKLSRVKIADESEDAGEKLNSVINTNFTGLVYCTREGLKLIRKSNNFGMIVNVSSINDSVIPFGIVGNVYPATKHAVKAFSEVLRQELIISGDVKIRVANLSPGVVSTEIFQAETGSPNYNGVDNFLKSEDVADSVIYLLSTPTNVNVTQLTIKPVGEKF